MKIYSIVSIIAMALLFNSCATILVGTKQSITIDSEPQDAHIIIEGKEIGKTPTQFEIKRELYPVKVSLRKDGFKPLEIEIEREGEPMFIWNITNGFLFCWIDFISGAVVKYPSYNKFIMTTTNETNKAIDNSMYDNLTKLKQLYDSGILTKEEFEEQKKLLLGK